MAVALKKGVYILSGKRTPFGRMGGALKDVLPADLLVAAAADAINTAKVAPAFIDTVNIGMVNGLSGNCNAALAPRHAALKCNIPQEKPALGVNRLCGSGFQAIVNSAQDILTGCAQISLAGGTENMSAVPFVVRNVRFGIPLAANIAFEDNLIAGSTDTFCKFSMPQTAENLAEEYKLTREEVDQFAYSSQQKWKVGNSNGAFDNELSQIAVTIKKKQQLMERDEHPRPETTLEGLATLPALFRKGGVVTAGNSSGVNDGAGALVLSNDEAMSKHGLKPLARLVGWSYVGVDPRIMGIGPVPAINNLLKATGVKLDDVDLIEINEAFAAQTLACVKALNLDIDKLNVNGGAVAIGHPVGASGARIMSHLVHELRRRGLRRGIGSACIGGGQGIALMVETV